MMRPQQWIVAMTACVLLLGQIVLASAETRSDVHGDIIRPGAEEFVGVFVHAHERTGDEPQVVVIDDSTYIIDSQTIFRNSHGALVALENFKEQTPIGFFALGTLLTKMWMIGEPMAEKKADDTVDKADRKADTQFFRDEKGVWIN
ncbi:MAG: hypothetical protein GXY53_01285 [Desulfobulbus sp.]|nr:hypothetical protein [Desulfobulbus sp.]